MCILLFYSILFFSTVNWSTSFLFLNSVKMSSSTCSVDTNYLSSVDYINTTAFIPPISCGKVIKVYDGDTFTIASALHNSTSPIYRFSVRLRDIDCPEIKGGSVNERVLAIIARNALHNMIFNKTVYLKNIKTDKYGRILAHVIYNNIDVSEWMLKRNYAIPYKGGAKITPDHWL